MRRKAAVIVAIISGLLCALLVFAYLQAVQNQAQEARADALERYGGETVQACVATRDIEPGEQVDASNATLRPWLTEMLPADAVLTFEQMSDRKVTSRILAGEVVSAKRFEGDFDAITIPVGLQAVSIDLGSAQAVGEMLKAGCVVDVYATGPTTTLVASQVLVASVEAGSYAGKCITLAVDPQNVQEIIAASQQTGIYLTLPSSSAALATSSSTSLAGAASLSASSTESSSDAGAKPSSEAPETSSIALSSSSSEPLFSLPKVKDDSLPASSESTSTE